MNKIIRIGTRDSRLAVWQATKVQSLLENHGLQSVLIKVKSEGDLDLVTPLYAMGVQGVFTKTLDAYLLSNKVDLVVHSMKDVPTQMAQGLAQGAVLKRDSYKDLFIYKDEQVLEKYFYGEVDDLRSIKGVVATGSVRRKAALLNRYPALQVVNLRGNVQTRMHKLMHSDWDAAIFAAAGLERLDERPAFSVELDWMLPAPAQGAILLACREDDPEIIGACSLLNDETTALCTKIERDFLKTLLGGCSTPICALAQVKNEQVTFKGNIYSVDGKELMEVDKEAPLKEANSMGMVCAQQLLHNGADKIVAQIRTNK